MTSIKDSVAVERNKLESSFSQLESAVEKLTASITQRLESDYKEKIKRLEETIQDLKVEIGNLSVELITQRDDNKKLKELNRHISSLIGQSIAELEKVVA